MLDYELKLTVYELNYLKDGLSSHVSKTAKAIERKLVTALDVVSKRLAYFPTETFTIKLTQAQLEYLSYYVDHYSNYMSRVIREKIDNVVFESVNASGVNYKDLAELHRNGWRKI